MNTPYFIRCTYNGDPIYYNVHHISVISEGSDGKTDLWLLGDPDLIPNKVDQTVDEVLAMIPDPGDRP